GSDRDKVRPGFGHRFVMSSEKCPYRLPDYETNRVGSENSASRRSIEAPDEGPLDDETKEADDDWSKRNSPPGVVPCIGDHKHGEATEQDEFAMCEIEDAHHASDDA